MYSVTQERLSLARVTEAKGLLAEFGLALLASAALVIYCTRLRVFALDLTNQVSAIGSMMVAFAFAIALPVVILALLDWRRPNRFTARAAAALLAGSTSGLVAGGITLALSGTSCAINSLGGDSGRLAIWAARPDLLPPEYPPLIPKIIGLLSTITGSPEPYSWKALSIALITLFGPVLYVLWRCVATPTQSLILGPVVGMAYLDPYKPFVSLGLGGTILGLVAAAVYLRNKPTAILAPLLIGLLFGVTILIYPGWLAWVAAGFVAFLVLLPWRREWRSQLRFLALSSLPILVVAGWWLLSALPSVSGIRDRFFYHDVWVRPTYFAAWFDDAPELGVRLPPFGPLGGVDNFTVLLILAVFLGVWLKGRSTIVMVLGLVFAGAWVWKMTLAGQMRETGLVQLFPRGNAVMLATALIIAAIALFAILRKLDGAIAADRRLAIPLATAAFLILPLAIATTASSITMRYMPSDSGKGALTKVAHTAPCWPIPENPDVAVD